MADIIYMTKTKWEALLDSIRSKAGSSAQMTVDDAKTVVDNMSGGAPDHYISFEFDQGGEQFGDISAEVHGLKYIRPYSFYNRVALASCTLPDDLLYIGDSAFYGCSVLRGISLPDTVSRIGSNAFRNCSNLSITALPRDITSIGQYSFSGTAIEELDVPEGLSSIPAHAFDASTLLGTIILRKTDGVVTLSSTNAFSNTKFRGTGGIAYVPEDLIETYKAATNWASLYAAGTLTFQAIEGSAFE